MPVCLPGVAGGWGPGLAAVDGHVGVVSARLQGHDTLPVVLDIIVISETNQHVNNWLLGRPGFNLLSLTPLSLGLSYLSLSLISLSLSMSLSLMSRGSLVSLVSLMSLGRGSTYRTECMLLLLLLLLRLLLSARRSSSNDIFQIFKLRFLFLYETARFDPNLWEFTDAKV